MVTGHRCYCLTRLVVVTKSVTTWDTSVRVCEDWHLSLAETTSVHIDIVIDSVCTFSDAKAVTVHEDSYRLTKRRHHLVKYSVFGLEYCFFTSPATCYFSCAVFWKVQEFWSSSNADFLRQQRLRTGIRNIFSRPPPLRLLAALSFGSRAPALSSPTSDFEFSG